VKPTLLVLAAGMGSRYGGLKQIDPMGPAGETVLDYSVHDAIRAGFGRVVFVIRKEFATAFQEGIGSRFAERIEVAYAYQDLTDLPAGFSAPPGRVKPWGTGHAIWAARHLISGAFAVINADDLYGQDAYTQAARFLSEPLAETGKPHHGLVAYPLLNTLSVHGSVNRGICSIDSTGLLTGVEEYVKIERGDDGLIRGESLAGVREIVADSTLVSMNFWAFSTGFFAPLEVEFCKFLTDSGHLEKSEFYIPTVVDTLIHQDLADCQVLTTTSRWFGVTYPEDKAHVVAALHSMIEAGEYPATGI
jgi:hypothetical protein